MSKFTDYVNQIDRTLKAPVTGDIVNFEIDKVKSISATVVEHTDKSVTIMLSEAAWNEMDKLHLLSEGSRQQMAEFVLTFERGGEKISKKFLHQPPMESAGITQDFVRNIAKSNKIHEMMKTEGYKLRHASASLVETDQLPESDVTVIVTNPVNTAARVTFECVFKKVDDKRSRLFLESIDCSTKTATAQHWSLPVRTRG